MWNKPAESRSSSQPASPAVSAQVRPPEAVRGPVASGSFTTAPPQAAPDTTGSRASKISSGLKVHGEISGNSDLYIDGETQGKIRMADARVVIGSSGRVQADIEAREIVVEGSVQGNLKAGEKVQLSGSSTVQGTLLAPRIGIEDGAKFRGKVEVTRLEANRQAVSAETAAEAETYRPVAVHAESE